MDIDLIYTCIFLDSYKRVVLHNNTKFVEIHLLFLYNHIHNNQYQRKEVKMGITKNKEDKIIHHSKNSKIPAILVVAIVVLSMILGINMGSKWQQAKADQSNHHTQITSDALHQEIEQIGELATVSYYYTNMGKFEDALKFFVHDVPFTTKSFILSYDGTIKAGIDLSEIEINISDTVITLSVPPAKILSHDVDMDSVIFYDEKNSIFNGISAEDVTKFLGNQQELMEEKAINNGLLMKAEENTQQVLKTLLNNFIKVNDETDTPYELRFVVKEADATKQN